MRKDNPNETAASEGIDRREFVKLSASIGAGAVAMAALGGCAQGSQSSSTSASSEQESESDQSASQDTAAQSTSQDTAQTTTGSGIKTDRSTPGAVKVYATRNITPEGLVAVYDALGWEPTGNVGVKLHMGEEGNPYYLQPSLLQQLVEQVDGTFIDCTVLYGGRRSTADGYASLASEHGFTYAPVDILDRDGGMSLPIEGGSQLTEAEVGSHFADYDSIISVAHFKGHELAGFGGTFKNLAIGLGTVQGKRSIHSNSFSSGDGFLERIAEFAKGVFDAMGDRMACINVLNNLSVDCDCDSSPEAPSMGDVGILASIDPVALDQASVDQVYLSDDAGKQAVIDRIESRNGLHLLEYAEGLGIGSREYELVVID
jgi:uncharacterized Fe-S center protein